ncbi:hypothetical protein ACTJ2V_003392 [Vibrio cholerae]
MVRTVLILLVIFFISLSISSGEKEAYSIIESNTPGILGALLGGIMAGIAIILSIIMAMSSGSKVKINFQSFDGLVNSLKIDVSILVFVLVLSLFLPYFRVVGIPLVNYPIQDFIPSRDVFYTAIEITSIIVSSSIIIEVFRVMLMLVSHFLSLISDNNDSEPHA